MNSKFIYEFAVEHEVGQNTVLFGYCRATLYDMWAAKPYEYWNEDTTYRRLFELVDLFDLLALDNEEAV